MSQCMLAHWRLCLGQPGHVRLGLSLTHSSWAALTPQLERCPGEVASLCFSLVVFQDTERQQAKEGSCTKGFWSRVTVLTGDLSCSSSLGLLQTSSK